MASISAGKGSSLALRKAGSCLRVAEYKPSIADVTDVVREVSNCVQRRLIGHVCTILIQYTHLVIAISVRADLMRNLGQREGPLHLTAIRCDARPLQFQPKIVYGEESR